MHSQVSRRRFLAGTAAIGTAMATASPRPAHAQARDNIAVRVDLEPQIVDPAFRPTPGDGNICGVVYQRLIKHKPRSVEFENDAAAEITQVNPTLVEFRLKPGQMFTDGFGEMTAEDVKYSFERFIHPVDGKESPYKGDWAGLDRVDVTGQYTGKIILTKPNAGLFAIAIGDFSGGIVSRKAIEQRGVEHNTKPVGSGPYQLVSLERQRGAVIKRNPNFAGTKPRFEQIDIRFVQDPRTTELALRSGELDFAVLPPQVAEPLRSVAGLAVDQSPGLAYVFLGMNMQKAPLSDLRVRQAIRLALDVDQMLLAAYNGKAPRLNSLVMQPVLGYWADAPVYKRNVAEAKRLLQAAGLGSGFKTRITVLAQPVYQNMALVARALLQDVGITLDVDVRDSGTYWSSGDGDAGKNLDLYICRFNGKLDPNFLMQWFTQDQIGSWNWSRFASADYDRLTADALAESDPKKRAQLVIQAQQVMDASAAFVWLTNETAFSVHRSWLAPAVLPGAIDWQYDDFGTV